MLNCTDVLCILHRHEEHVQSRLQDHRAHHEHQVQVMSGDAINVLDDQIIKNYFNVSDTELSSLSHLDDPNEGIYILCGVLIAMAFVVVIILLVAFFISKLRKREDSAVTNNNSTNICNNNPPPVEREVLAQTLQQEPPPFLWYRDSSQQVLCNNDQLQSSIIIPTEETGECKGFRKNLRGKWRRLVKKKPAQEEVYTIPAEYRDQLKQIYVY